VEFWLPLIGDVSKIWAGGGVAGPAEIVS